MSAQSHWGWRPRQTEGIWRHGCAWTKPLFAAVPWITLTLLLALFCYIGDRLPQVPGLVCDLPDPVAGQAEATGLAALVLPAVGAGGETLVFFDDARHGCGRLVAEDEGLVDVAARKHVAHAADEIDVVDLRAPQVEEPIREQAHCHASQQDQKPEHGPARQRPYAHHAPPFFFSSNRLIR